MNIIGMKMILEISSNRRAEIKNRVLSILKKYGQPCVPVKIGNIIRGMNNVKLIVVKFESII